jgi:D-alanyl-D-alanine carboxypeptidase
MAMELAERRRRLAVVLVLSVAACGGETPTATRGTTGAATTSPATPVATETDTRIPVTPFPTTAFAKLSAAPLATSTASKLQAALALVAGRGGMTATVLTPQGTWSGAVGTADGEHDLVPESQFGIASITKSIIAAQVMQLVEAGALDLDRPATDYLPPGFAFDTNGATIRQLLSHRSGIPDWFDDAMQAIVASDRTHVWTTAEVLARLPSQRAAADAAFEYADTNYTLLGLVLEHVRGKRLVDVLRDGVLDVDGTERLVYQPDEAPTAPMAMPMGEPASAFERGGGYLPSMSDASSAGPAGSIASDSISLATWWRAFCAGEIVSQASLTEMWRYYDGADGYGLGLFNVADPWASGVGHTGSNFGYASWAGCMPAEGAVVVMLANQYVDDTGGMARPLVEALRAD